MQITFTIPARLEEVPPIRNLVKQLAKENGLPQKLAFNASLITDELCNNAIEHGSKKNSKVILHMQLAKRGMRITCEDEGKDHKVSSAKLTQLMASAHPEKGIRGRGLAKLVKSYAKTLEIENTASKGIRVIATVGEI